MYAFSIDDLRRRHACDLWSRVRALEDHLARKVPEDEAVPLQVWAAVTPDMEDLIWALCVRPEGWPTLLKVTLHAVERAAAYAGSTRPVCEAAVAAARGYLAGKVSWTDLNARGYAARTYADDGAFDAYASDAAYTAYAVARAVCGNNTSRADDALYYAARASGDSIAERARQRRDLLEVLSASEV